MRLRDPTVWHVLLTLVAFIILVIVDVLFPEDWTKKGE